MKIIHIAPMLLDPASRDVIIFGLGQDSRLYRWEPQEDGNEWVKASDKQK